MDFEEQITGKQDLAAQKELQRDGSFFTKGTSANSLNAKKG